MKLKLTAIAITIAILLVTVGAAFAQNDGSTGVVVLTEPFNANSAVFWDYNGDGVNDDNEFIGFFDLYSIWEPIDIAWAHFNFAPGTNGSYKVALYQDAGDGNLYVGRLAHHWAENPNGEMFTFGSLGWGEPICLNCPSFFGVTAETYVKFYDPATDTYEYEYTTVAGAPSIASYWFAFEAP
jgi:hypothetical protein